MKITSKHIVVYVCYLLIAVSGFRGVYAGEDRVKQFEKALNSYEVNGLSLGAKLPVIQKTLSSDGYRIKNRLQKRKSIAYVYVKREAKSYFKVIIRATKTSGIVHAIETILPNPNDEKKIAEEKIRLLKAFAGSCKSRGYYIRCVEYTDTNALTISVKFSKKSIQYSISNEPSGVAKNLSHARGHAH